MTQLTRLKGTGRLADDLYLLAHDDVSGKPFLQPRALGLGLAGALIAELMFAGALWIERDQLIFPQKGEAADDLGRHVLGILLAEPEPHSMREWLLFLAVSSGQDVSHRLERAGYLRQVDARWPWRAVRLQPVDSDAAFAPLIRARAALDPHRSATVADAVLTSLAVACGLGSRLMPYAPAGARTTLRSAIRHLPPGLRDLLAATHAAVDSALLSHRV